MDKASDYESGDSRLKYFRGRLFFLGVRKNTPSSNQSGYFTSNNRGIDWLLREVKKKMFISLLGIFKILWKNKVFFSLANDLVKNKLHLKHL